ncbi:DUF3467 domain-containing protein [Mariprofundus sp. EBB-1]|uniref:DUF3467 domain-containing protein n=1 Tax=Mariprofundus sp. EBB-1 TaxID=2650971 RepID=UPI000EF1C323|nr:DUF3467 domain-containing protein [Mariprofundus sp. EBB-1]RLL51907.1 DUF3467 domain-containing protein [Mariprofundus sp. EBB-1]
MASKDGNNSDTLQELQVQVPEDVQRGTYANHFISSHTPEEFILDFILTSPPAAVVNARVVVTPAHAKRIAAALLENVSRYEAVFGEISTVTPITKPDQELTH